VRPGEALLLKAIELHFGRFGGLSVRVTWVVLGLVPVFLVVSGVVLWWTGRRARAKLPATAGATAGAAAATDVETAPDSI
jgi:uncharacterized iron-regulated membrane protein